MWVNAAALLAWLIVWYAAAPSPDTYDISATLLRSGDALRTCLRELGTASNPPWLAVYGDSLGRGVFFDLLSALNGSSSGAPHPGHFANYSAGCTLEEERPPTLRRKCGGFAYDVSLGSGPPLRPAPLAPPTDPPGGGGAPRLARLTFRLKTFSWEPAFDEAWLRQLRQAARLPDVLLLSFGIWDMQYPPGAAAGEAGAAAFSEALGRFLAALERALHRRNRPRPRVYWLAVTAVAQARLPAWKRPRMSASLAQRYTELAEMTRLEAPAAPPSPSRICHATRQVQRARRASAPARRHRRGGHVSQRPRPPGALTRRRPLPGGALAQPRGALPAPRPMPRLAGARDEAAGESGGGAAESWCCYKVKSKVK